MENGWLMLLIIALFFLSMYAYAYGTTNYAEWKKEKDKKKRLLEAKAKEEKIKAEMLERQKLRDEKYKIANKRSLEIQQELKHLEQLKQKQGEVKA